MAKPVERERARALRASGWSRRAIAHELGVALPTVSRWVSDLGPEAQAEPRRPQPSPDRAEPHAYCGRCRRSLPMSAFSRRGNGVQSWCKECYRAYFQARGRLHVRQSLAAKRRRREVAREFIDDYLRDRSCVDCGEPDPAVLEFDHVAEKRGEIGRMVAEGASVAWLREEVSRCEVVCANCHRRRTQLRLRSWRVNPGRLSTARLLPAQRRNLELVRRALARGCVDCGTSQLAVLDFDHVRAKAASVVKLARDGVSLARLAEEISRCEVRCANCHRRRHARERTRGHGGSTIRVAPVA